jgi:hypothetical protein
VHNREGRNDFAKGRQANLVMQFSNIAAAAHGDIISRCQRAACACAGDRGQVLHTSHRRLWYYRWRHGLSIPIAGSLGGRQVRVLYVNI